MDDQPKRATTDRMFQLLSAIVIATVAALLLATYATRLMGKSHSKTQENNAYMRVDDCKTSIILLVVPERRNKAMVDRCYQVVEKDLGIQLKRYDKEL